MPLSGILHVMPLYKAAGCAGLSNLVPEFKKSGDYNRLPYRDEKSERKKLLKYLDNKNYEDEKEAVDNIFNNEKITPIAELLDTLPVFEAKA